MQVLPPERPRHLLLQQSASLEHAALSGWQLPQAASPEQSLSLQSIRPSQSLSIPSLQFGSLEGGLPQSLGQVH